jgi:hypothetical protein
MAVKKWTITVDEALAARVESHVGEGLSGFVARAVEHELERDLLDEYLDELDAKFGPLPEGLAEQLDELWPSWISTAKRSRPSPTPSGIDFATSG